MAAPQGNILTGTTWPWQPPPQDHPSPGWETGGRKASRPDGQGGRLGQGHPLRRWVLGSTAWELLLGLGWDGAHMLGRGPGGGKELEDLLFEEGTWGTGTWGVAGRCNGVGAGAGSCSLGSGGGAQIWDGQCLDAELSVPRPCGNTQQRGLGDPPPQQSHLRCMSMGAGVLGPWAESLPEGSPPAPPGPTGSWDSPSQVPHVLGKGLHPQPRGARGCLGPRAQPRLSQGVWWSRPGCWCRSRSLGWLTPARRGRSPW